MGHFTGITGHDNSMSSLIRKDIARLVDRVYDIVEDEAGLAVEKEIGPCEGLYSMWNQSIERTNSQ